MTLPTTTPRIPPCPTCGAVDCVTAVEPLFTGRKHRKQQRTQRNLLMLRVRAGMRGWECSRCAKGWFTHDEE